MYTEKHYHDWIERNYNNVMREFDDTNDILVNLVKKKWPEDAKTLWQISA